MTDQKPTLEYATPPPTGSRLRSLSQSLKVLLFVAALGIIMLTLLFAILYVLQPPRSVHS
jgi:hypothetical protein